MTTDTSLLDRLGVRQGQQVDVLDLPEGFLIEALQQRGADLSLRPRRSSELILLGVADQAALAALGTIRRVMDPAGAVWVVFPRSWGAAGPERVLSAAGGYGLEGRGETVPLSETQAAVRLTVSGEEVGG